MLIYMIAAAGLHMLSRLDREAFGAARPKTGLGMFVLCCMNETAVGAVFLCQLKNCKWKLADLRPAGAELLYLVLYLGLSLFAGCLMLACMTDRLFFQVYNLVWWAAWTVGGFLLFFSENRGSLAGLLFFCILQQCLFSRFYGRADCHAFCACALISCVLGGGFTGHMIHMLLAFLLLTGVQWLRKNINSRGNLKAPVAFLPYITVSFWLLLFGTQCFRGIERF